MSFFTPLIDLFFPNLCLTCNETLLAGEQFICLKCLNEIPKTNFHHVAENAVERRFWGKVPVENATAYFFFEKGSKFQHLLHELKYKGNKEVGHYLGKVAAPELLQNKAYHTIDCLAPVPLHPKRQAKRGYNQSEWIAKGLAEIMDKPLSVGNLVRSQENTTQTKKTVYERFENTKGIFDVRNPEEFNGKHILLIDDVLTTGSTLEACVRTLQAGARPAAVSVFTLAVAQ